jgi:hypothetical protein
VKLTNKLAATAQITNRLKMLTLFLLATASSAFSHNHTDNQITRSTPISLYQANYSAELSGLKINALQKLEKLESGIYQESLNAKNFIGKVDEQSTFSLENNQLYPSNYSYIRSVFGRDRSEVHHFDWQSSKVRYEKDGSANSELPIKAGYLDMITHRLQLRRDLNAGKEVFSYPVISRGNLKHYNYKIVSEQILQTALGPLNTVRVDRVIEDGDKTVRLWLASDWDYLIVKLEQSQGKDGYYLNLQGAVVNNKPITPLVKTNENQL